MKIKWLKRVIKQNLQDQFLQKWYSDMNNSSKGQVFRIFKQTFGMEYYLKTLSPKNQKIFVKFRTANHHLPVETGRWHRKFLSERFCILCNSGQIGDEFHFILECKSLENLRKNYLCKYYYQNPYIIKFHRIHANSQKESIGKTLLFIVKIYDAACLYF